MASVDDILNKLNAEQLQAATTINGYVRIVAGAGCGKTRTLVARTAYMISQNISASNILLLTFTKAAANEMANRIVKLIGENGEGVCAMTFHSFCLMIIKRYYRFFGFKSSKDILTLSNNDVKTRIKDIRAEYFDEMGYTDDKQMVKEFPEDSEIIEFWSKIVNGRFEPIDFLESEDCHIDSIFFEDVMAIIKRFIDYKRKYNYFDYDDMLLGLRVMLQNDKGRQMISSLYPYVMCDEYQDTSVLQDELLYLLTKDSKNLCVVGDDNQSIYRFRCANVENIVDFGKRYYPFTNIVLRQNYRSTQDILDFANIVMKQAKEGIPKTLIGGKYCKPVRCRVFGSYDEQATALCDAIKAKLAQNIEPSKIAILFRNSKNSKSVLQLEKRLRANDIPYMQYGGMNFFDKACVHDVLCFVRAYANISDPLAWHRMLALLPGIGKSSAERIYDMLVQLGFDKMLVSKGLSITQKTSLCNLYSLFKDCEGRSAAFILQYFSDYYLKLESNKLRKSLKNYEKAVEKYEAAKRDIELLCDMGKDYVLVDNMLTEFMFDMPVDNKNECVVLSTIHSAKGCEYHTVYIVDPIEGIIPKNGYADSAETREDLRCLYVAITRAEADLCFCLVRYAMMGQKPIKPVLSSFLDRDEIVNKLLISGDLSAFRRNVLI